MWSVMLLGGTSSWPRPLLSEKFSHTRQTTDRGSVMMVGCPTHRPHSTQALHTTRLKTYTTSRHRRLGVGAKRSEYHSGAFTVAVVGDGWSGRMRQFNEMK